MKSPSLFAKNERIASCVDNLVFVAPYGSLSPNPTSDDIPVIVISERLSFRADSSLTVTLLANTMLPVLLYAVIKSPTVKSPSSLVPEV